MTDVQLKFTKEGKFRHFAFVGFQNGDEAQAALDYFDNTFLNSLRIKVEPCSELGAYFFQSFHFSASIVFEYLISSLGDKNKPKSWSKYAPDSTAYKKEHSAQKTEEAVIKIESKTKKKKSKFLPEVEDKLKEVIIYI